MKRTFTQLAMAISLTLPGVSALAASVMPADQVFFGDHIITMDPAQEQAEAVAIRGDKIVFVGDEDKARTLVGADTRVVELGDKALVPGLIDAHGHVAMAARFIDFINVSSPPVGTVESIDDIVALLKAHIANTRPAKGEWILAYGYDDSLLAENRHPTREDLDKISTDNPIYMMHVSGHLGTSNSAALAAVGINANTPNPAGGVFRRQADGKTPNGVVEEKAAYALLMPQFMAMAKNPELFKQKLAKTVEYFASYGVTTIQDGASQLPDLATMRAMGEQGLLAADVIAFPASLDDHHGGEASGDDPGISAMFNEGYHGGVRVGGVKFVLDGSPQGRTAWMTKPYTTNPEGVEGDYTAYPTVEPVSFKAAAKEKLQAGIPILMHANGDAAIDLALDAVEEAFAGQAIPDHRAVIIHSQVMRKDQLDRAKTLKVIPSFYAAHPFFWGDWHRLSFGDERAFGISPAASALAKGVPFTIHNDTPVVPPDMMRLLWVAVNRETRKGVILGPDERISPKDALNAMTLTAAYQYFEEDIKGSLTEGKQADLVILGADPLTVDPKTIKDIPVLETISHGKTIFQR
ncbi:amidohydrolase family protein [Aestuariicella hydrocarbonica]|uniref:Amidohydrolase family protein n=1 Tax=Pseudomaricurvus hydrocarbonicus TaxID=1470433 RepID=A0A9E5MQA5_9GAMM|nr:amidohydrolase [Aestuariicella hydrocarbonica]NHO68363.1 amidohydrolase family protein [Aestuariicella hydrocarbonica]